jgi:glyoxylase-like metal-dependent hydrolase (beta-lactamase superfamily II)
MVNTDCRPEVTVFYHEDTSTFSYIVKDPDSTACAVVDSVMDFDNASGRLGSASADKIIETIRAKNLNLQWIVETHVHADHISAAPHIQEALGGKIGICQRITTIQQTFGKIFNEGDDFLRDGSQFDKLFADGECYKVGAMDCYALQTPGHTPACMTHVMGDAAFVGDTLFMPDGGTARADFPGGNARTLYQSIQKILSFPDETRLFMCHDYREEGEQVKHLTTVAEQKAGNIHIHAGVTEDEFVAMREARDKTLAMPRLILPSLQINMRAGYLPEPEDNGVVYLKLPLNRF